jgi:hypothetical protein
MPHDHCKVVKRVCAHNISCATERHSQKRKLPSSVETEDEALLQGLRRQTRMDAKKMKYG